MKLPFRIPYLGRALLAALVAGLIALGFLVFYLDARVRAEFEGRRFALPARVYARPLELFAGARLGPEDLALELRQLGYQEELQGDEPRRFRRQGEEFELVTPPFVFWDGAQDKQFLHLIFADGRLAGIADARDQTPLTLARLDPEYIGGIYPGHNEPSYCKWGQVFA